MAYLGRGLDKISNIEVLDNITFDGSSSYSITKNSVAFTPNSAQSCLISIDGVVQATNFSVNSSTIDFGVAIPSTSTCNFFLHYGTGVMTLPSDGSVTTAKLGSNAVSSAKMFSGFANGITMADGWRLTANTNTGTNTVVSTNWERMDTNEFSQIGTGLTESSGVFTFPTTGIYWIHYVGRLTLNNGDTAANYSLQTTNDNSTWLFAGYASGGNGSASNSAGTVLSNNIFDVQDTSNYKIRFSTGSFTTATNLNGNTNDNRTHFIVIRLGDT